MPKIIPIHVIFLIHDKVIKWKNKLKIKDQKKTFLVLKDSKIKNIGTRAA